MEFVPDTVKNFRGSCYIIQFTPYVTSKMELFVAKDCMGTVVDCCYRELRLKCNRAPTSDSEMNK